jgi:thioredoxin:protein disulfide reductase
MTRTPAFRRLVVCVALGVLAPLAWAAEARQTTNWVTLTPLVESESVPAGMTIRLALEAKIADGFHIQSNHPRDASLIAATLKLDPPAGLMHTESVFPESTDLSIPAYDKPLAVFEGSILIGAQVTIPKHTAPGVITLPAHFRYQACNDTQCFVPKTIDATWTFQVVPAGIKVNRQHAEVFGRIAFGHGESPAALAAVADAESPASGEPLERDPLKLLDQFTVLGFEGGGGYMNTAQFLASLHNAENGVKTGAFEGRGPLAILALVFLGGLALNLTPCVLPMIPINLAIIGAGSRSKRRGRGFALGAAYGSAMAVVYGVLGLIVILTAGTFGTINSSPWFNLAIAGLFVVLGLAMFDVISLDFSRYSSKIRFGEEGRGSILLAFAMGGVAALLAGACVAPVVIQVVVFATNMYASGTRVALALPFFLGLGMALPWPIAGAGLSALPKPGAWMVRVKQAMGIFILATAAYYAYVGYGIFANRSVDPASVSASAAEKVKEGWVSSLGAGLQTAKRTNTPVLIDLWATWCKNCLTMDKTTLADPEVTSALAGYTKVKFNAEDPELSPAKELMRKVGAVGLPAYVILRPK